MQMRLRHLAPRNYLDLAVLPRDTRADPATAEIKYRKRETKEGNFLRGRIFLLAGGRATLNH